VAQVVERLPSKHDALTSLALSGIGYLLMS
jgi:hypothetical protein